MATYTRLVAEVGSTHDGNLDKLLGLVHMAKVIGADAVKLQWISSVDRLVARRNAASYRDAYARIAFPEEWLDVAKEEADRHGLEFWCTVYLPEDVYPVAQRARTLKLASFEAGDEALWKAVRAAQKPVVVSTGMQDTTQAQATCRLARPGDAVLHCVSAYPTPMEQANLKAMRWLRAHVNPAVRVGFSDHTGAVITGAIAATLGAEVIEFHVALPSTDHENPDLLVALQHPDAVRYVQFVRQAENLIRDVGIKHVQDAEEPMRAYLAREMP